MRRRLALAAVALLAAGCGSDTPPQVTFTAADTSVNARPTQYCDLKLTECSDDAAAPVRLAVPAGTPLRVAVPDDVAEAPWHVVFSYRSEGGEQLDARSPLFAADEQHDYTLTLPAPADRLVAVPDGVAEAPWHVVFSYRNEGGEQVDARSPLFAAEQQHEYTLTLPAPADRLVAAQVQQFGPAPQINEDTGEIEFPVRGSWVLTATGT